jgi:hypothetical protein
MRSRNAWFIVACLLVVATLAAPGVGAAGGAATAASAVPLAGMQCPPACLVCKVGFTCSRNRVGCFVCTPTERGRSCPAGRV